MKTFILSSMDPKDSLKNLKNKVKIYYNDPEKIPFHYFKNAKKKFISPKNRPKLK